MSANPNSLSNNIIKVIQSLSKNEGLLRLLVNNTENPFVDAISSTIKSNIIKPSSEYCKIFPYPFNPDAQINDTSFIRVYYNDASFDDTETINEMVLNIDIVVAKSLWLIHDDTKSMIRPYEIMSRVIDLVGKKSANPIIRIGFDGLRHLFVNEKFDAIRLYSNYYSVETGFFREEDLNALQ